MRFVKSRMHKKKLVGLCIICILFVLLIVRTLLKKESPLTFLCHKNQVYMDDETKVQGYRTVKELKKGEEMDESYLEAVLCNKEEQPANLNEILESKTRMKLGKGILVSSSNLSRKKNLSDDVRIHNFPYIQLTNHLKKGDYIDVRISFSNGGDFVLLSKKKIEDITFMDTEGTKGNSLWLNVTEEELLRLSSAVVDAYTHEGCKIYAIQYIDHSQKAAIINYSVGALIKQLMADDPNIIKRAESVIEWSLWNEYRGYDEQQKRLFNPDNEDVKEDNSMFETYPKDNIQKDI